MGLVHHLPKTLTQLGARALEIIVFRSLVRFPKPRTKSAAMFTHILVLMNDTRACSI